MKFKLGLVIFFLIFVNILFHYLSLAQSSGCVDVDANNIINEVDCGAPENEKCSICFGGTNDGRNKNNNINSDVNKVNSPTLPNLKVEEPGALINQFYNFFLIISGLLAFGTIVYGGVQRILGAGNPSKISDANEWIKNALIGLLLLFGAYIILNIINPRLVQLKLPELEEVKSDVGGGGGVSSGAGGSSRGGVALSDAEARNKLASAGIGSKTTNTTLEGMKQATVDELIRMKNECDAWMKKYYPNENKGQCNVFITGGTENGPHSNKGTCNHGNGYKADFGLNSRLNEFIEKTYCCKRGNKCTYCDVRMGDGALMYYSPTGAVYAKESNHWDFQATFACP
jgi:hypothetical protein